jgi:hypothetical protein
MYSMFYVALVTDESTAAANRVTSAFRPGVPTSYFDGGYSAMMGGFPTGGGSLVPYYEPEIVAAGMRAVPTLDLLTAIDWLGNNRVRLHVAVGNGVTANTAPPTPSILMGGGRVQPATNMLFASEATDPEANVLLYKWDFGDGQITDWLGPYNSGATSSIQHAWTENGNYEVKVKVRDPFGEETAWSAPTAVTVSCCTGRIGDANGSGEDMPTIGDISVMIDAKFITGDCIQSGPGANIRCLGEADANTSGGANPTCDDITIGDISMLIDDLFITGEPPFIRNDCGQ